MVKTAYLSSAPLYDEKELLTRLASGDEEALAEIYRLHWQSLFVSAYNILKDASACEDILQDIFLTMWQKKGSLVIHESLHAYLYMATRYQVFRYIKNGTANQRFFNGLEEHLSVPSPESELHVKEITGKISEVVNSMPEKCRIIYKLSREQQLSHKEIAERLNISPKTVENQLTIALRKLRVEMSELFSFFLFL